MDILLNTPALFIHKPASCGAFHDIVREFKIKYFLVAFPGLEAMLTCSFFSALSCCCFLAGFFAAGNGLVTAQLQYLQVLIGDVRTKR